MNWIVYTSTITKLKIEFSVYETSKRKAIIWSPQYDVCGPLGDRYLSL